MRESATRITLRRSRPRWTSTQRGGTAGVIGVAVGDENVRQPCRVKVQFGVERRKVVRVANARIDQDRLPI